ncbi:LysE/ArgO family amino acid transporter [Marinomonas fungiae]|uniref:Arginine exporter protein ArgO n=1 Tax=Marinomonas fungiae TaxID=1137284 RepID=A0A0K6IN46_9GAMM|nr:LysE/ArgO family amino acid transporter [Marinomonas fungiae]CUB04524.1 Arginine exporter protein ArgO [Marinomonas fungiae]
MLTALLSGFTTGAGLIIAIGSQNAFVLRQGLMRHHIGAVVAITSLSDILLISCGVAGIGILVEAWPSLVQYLRWGGAAFLAFYGLQAAQRAWSGSGALHAAQQTSSASLKTVVLTCLAFTFLNPHVYLDTMVLLGSLSANYPGFGQIAFAIGACCASLVWFIALGYGARLLRPVFNSPLAWRILDASIAVFMLTLSALMLS